MNIITRLDRAYRVSSDPDAVAKALQDPWAEWRLIQSIPAKDFKNYKGRKFIIYDPRRNQWGSRPRIINTYQTGYRIENYATCRTWCGTWFAIAIEYQDKPCHYSPA